MQINATLLEIRVKGYWVPFAVFEQGKHVLDINNFIEEASCQQDQETEAMVLAEALSTDIRYVDEYRGISYQVEFKRGAQTTISSHTLTGLHIKTFERGAMIPLEWKGALEHVLDV